jgi:peptide deformylase
MSRKKMNGESVLKIKITKLFVGIGAFAAMLSPCFGTEVHNQSEAAVFEKSCRVLKIARMGHAVLMQKAGDVQDPTDPKICAIVDDMKATLEDIGGFATGLAAPQVHISLRIVLVSVPERHGPPVPLTVMINPVWEPISTEKELGWDCCLSLPGLAGEVPRYTKICYQYQTLDGETVSGEASGYLARVIQHECDHLDGILYPQRMIDHSRFGFIEEVKKFLVSKA